MTHQVRIEVVDSLDARSALLALLGDGVGSNVLRLERQDGRVVVTHDDVVLGRIPNGHPFSKLTRMPSVIDFRVEGNPEKPLRSYLTIEVEQSAIRSI